MRGSLEVIWVAALAHSSFLNRVEIEGNWRVPEDLDRHKQWVSAILARPVHCLRTW